jgi:hypothetical protein
MRGCWPDIGGGVEVKNVRCSSRNRTSKLRRMQSMIDSLPIDDLRNECRTRKFVIVRNLCSLGIRFKRSSYDVVERADKES